MKTTVSYANCSLFVIGLDMNCPLCKVLVKSGQRHACSKPEIEQKKLPRKKRAKRAERLLSELEVKP